MKTSEGHELVTGTDSDFGARRTGRGYQQGVASRCGVTDWRDADCVVPVMVALLDGRETSALDRVQIIIR